MQFGLHALLGFWLLQLLSPLGLHFAAGVCLGSVFPDLDVYVEAVGYVSGAKDATSFHRTAAHSAVIASCILAAAELLLWFLDMRERRSDSEHGTLAQRPRTYLCDARIFLRGAWVGALLHMFCDIFFWFSPVDIAWPLSSPLIASSPPLQPLNLYIANAPLMLDVFLSNAEHAAMVVFFHVVRVAVAPQSTLLSTLLRRGGQESGVGGLPSNQ